MKHFNKSMGRIDNSEFQFVLKSPRIQFMKIWYTAILLFTTVIEQCKVVNNLNEP